MAELHNHLLSDLARPRLQFQCSTPRVTAGVATLFCKSLCIDGCIHPGHGPLRHRRPAVQHEILEGHHYDSLGEGVTIPFGKPDFSFLKPNNVLVGAQNQRDSGRDRTIAAEFPLNY